jgi:hypothetical protein
MRVLESKERDVTVMDFEVESLAEVTWGFVKLESITGIVEPSPGL